MGLGDGIVQVQLSKSLNHSFAMQLALALFFEVKTLLTTNNRLNVKPILPLLFGLLFCSVAFAQNIETKLWSYAKKQYPDDVSMQKFVYEQQKKGYDYMTTVTDAEVKRFAENEYPEDFSMQKFVYDKQKANKAYMKTVTDLEIKHFALNEYAKDYSMQKFVYDRQTLDKEYMWRASNTAAKEEAIKQYPDDYSMQNFIYDKAVN